MKEVSSIGFSDNDILLLVETVAPQLVSEIDTIKGDPSIVESMLDSETGKVFQRIMLMGKDEIVSRISPRFLFEVLLRRALGELQNQSHTMERTASQRVPVFDSREVVRFLSSKKVLKYLADMLSSFTKVESYAVPVQVRQRLWRKIRFSDMDIDSLVRLCEAVDEQQRFSLYKRIADLCLFILGIFPEHTTFSFHHSSTGGVSRLFGRLRRSTEDYEEEGRRFYKLAAEHKNAVTLNLAEVLWQLHDKFNLAEKPLNYITENFLSF